MPTTLSQKTLRGILPALVTPRSDDGEVDERRFVDEIRAFGGTGVHGIYTGGSTGELYAQDDRTFERITAVACREGHEIGVVAGTSQLAPSHP